jgi:hypothetical protein
MKPDSIQIHDTTGETVEIRSEGWNEWTVIQRNYGAEQDNNQNPTWLSVFNAGKKARVKINIQWAIFDWMGYHKIGYLKQAGKYSAIRGKIMPTATHYEFEVPNGKSFFGAFPWFSNEDNEYFLRDISAGNPRCAVRSIGQSGDGREIRCLTIADKSASGRKQNVVIIGREHATESSGSFAVMGSAKYLAGGRAPKNLFERYNFHLFPIVNPDGTARGLKLTRPGKVKKYDMAQGGISSNDPTIKALREEVLRLRPAVLIMHHCYLMSELWLGFFDKEVGLILLKELIGESEKAEHSWSIRNTGPEPHTLRWHCHKHFHSTVVFTELPWTGRLPSDIEKLGEDILRGVLIAHEKQKNLKVVTS